MKRLRKRYSCATELTLDCLAGKWKTVLLCWLKDGPLRYSDLAALEEGLSDKVLTERLRELEEAGFVERLTAAADGRRVYGLTGQGLALKPVLEALYDWGEAMAPAFGVSLTGRDRYREALGAAQVELKRRA